jgi:DNA repair exonuclease SbcCD ATPase subunit
MESKAQSKLQEFNSGVDKLRNYRDFISSQISNFESEVSDLEYKSQLYQKCSEMFKKWLEDSIEQNINSISELVTTGLNHVIYDQNLKFKIQQEMKYNRISMKFILEDEDGAEGDPLVSFGGGPTVIISYILRLAMMARLGMGNLLLLDESMASLANFYIPNAATFMKKLSEQTGINVLMVTHNNEFLQRAHVAYEAFKDKSLHLRKVQVSTDP